MRGRLLVAALMHWPTRLRHPRMYRMMRNHLDLLCSLHYVRRPALYLRLHSRKDRILGEYYAGRYPGSHFVCVYSISTTAGGYDDGGKEILEHEFTHYLRRIAGLYTNDQDHSEQFYEMLGCVIERSENGKENGDGDYPSS